MNERKLIDFCKKLKREFETQDTDYQAHPRFWVIMDYKEIVVPEGHGDYMRIYDGEQAEVYTTSEYIKIVRERLEDGEFDDGINEQLQPLLAYLEESDDGTELEYLIELVGDRGCDIFFGKEEPVIVPNTFFLTKQDAKDYLERYGYNHSPKAHTYAMTAIRSPRYEQLIDLIMEVE